MGKRKSKGVVNSNDNSYSESEASDMDSEMLNLAKKRKNSISNNKMHSAAESESDNETVPQKPASTSSTSKKRSRRTNLDSEPEEGELTDTDSSEVSQEEFNDGYADDLMGDDEDRRRLNMMTEKEREQEIFKRIEAREVMRTRFNIERKLKQAKKQELKKHKFGYDRHNDEPPSLDLKERVLERKKTAEENRGKSSDKKFQALNLLKARREVKREREEKEKQLKMEQEKHKREHASNSENSHKTKLKASDVYSDDSGSSSEGEDDRSPPSKPSNKKERPVSSSSSSSSDSDTDERSHSDRLQYVSTQEQLNTIRLSRFKLEKLVNLPFFKKVATGCFVRVMIGMNDSKPVYRICEISDVSETGKIYTLGTTRTNKILRLRHGTQERVFRMEFVSNQEFTNLEFAKWKEMCETQGISVPTIDEFDNKVKEIHDAMTYEFKEEDVEKMVKEKERFKTTPYNYAMKKTQLMKERDMAQSMGETEKLMELQDQLNQLETRANELDRLRTSSISSISYINNRNRRKNVEEAEKAILAELRATKGQRADDPFTRRHTKPSMMIKAKRPEEKANVTESDIDKSAAVANEAGENEPKKANPQKHGEDMYAAHDFEIKFDFEVPNSVTPIVAPVHAIQAPSANKSRSLNLEDYKRRKGFI